MILNGLPWKRTEIILSFLRLHPSTVFWTLLLTMIDGDLKKCQDRDFPGGPVVKNLLSNAGDVGLIPGQGTKELPRWR